MAILIHSDLLYLSGQVAPWADYFTFQMDKHAARMSKWIQLSLFFSELREMDERATRMSEWIEERMWLFETEREERRPEEWMFYWPWNALVTLTAALFGLLIYLVILLINGGSLDPSRLFPVYH